jgi:hypothetical protein
MGKKYAVLYRENQKIYLLAKALNSDKKLKTEDQLIWTKRSNTEESVLSDMKF